MDLPLTQKCERCKCFKIKGLFPSDTDICQLCQDEMKIEEADEEYWKHSQMVSHEKWLEEQEESSPECSWCGRCRSEEKCECSENLT